MDRPTFRSANPRPSRSARRCTRGLAAHLSAVAAAFTAVVVGAVAAGCAPEPAATYPRAWQRLDLWFLEPQVALSRGPLPGSSQPWGRRLGFLGMDEVRNMELVPESALGLFPQRRSGEIRTLVQAAGSRLAWTVELGDDPYASFIPLGSPGDPDCPCTYRFGLRDAAGGLHELWRQEAGVVTPIARAAVEVDLADYAGSTVELLMQVEVSGELAAGPLPTLLWGSPAVLHREPQSRRPGVVPTTTPTGPTVPENRPNVLLVAVDTLRADHVGAFLEAPPPGAISLTPAIDRLAGESDVWTSAYATFSNTNPSFASIMTGLYGKDHGVYDLRTPLPAEHTTLAELFDQAGYDTLAIISASHLGDHNSGLAQGFDEVTTAPHHFAGELATDMAIDWIVRREAPFFVWLHLFDPHTPTTPPDPYAVGFRPAHPTGLAPAESWLPFRRPGSTPFVEPVLGAAPELYAGEVAYVDRQIDRLLGFLDSQGLLGTTVVALVADHGENLDEHGMLHRHVGLWETTTHVPLLVRWPGELMDVPRGRRLSGLVQTLDLFPTLAAAARLEVPDNDGLDLRALAAQAGRSEGTEGPSGGGARRAVFAEHADRTDVAVRTATHRYVRSRGNPRVAPGTYLFDLTADPSESTNLAGRGLAVEAELSRLLDGWLAHRRDSPEARRRDDLSTEELDKLRALGYL